jgi:hypothetical protein
VLHKDKWDILMSSCVGKDHNVSQWGKRKRQGQMQTNGVSCKERKGIMSDIRKYKVELTAEQCDTLCAALELYGRIGLGQLEVVGEHMHHLHKSKELKVYEVRDLLAEVKRRYTGFMLGASYGVGNKEVPESFTQALDMYQVVRHRLAWDRYPEGGFTVNFHEPMKWGKHELCKIEEVKDVKG